MNGIEVKLQKMRQYRTLIHDEVQTAVESFIAAGCTRDAGEQLSPKIEMLHLRERLMNVEIDKLEAIRYGRTDAQPNIPELALA
jgi:hypothetical protein